MHARCFFFFFYVHSALISGDSAGCVISVSSTRAVNNLHSRLLVARRSLSPGGCRIKEAARAVGSVSAGFSTKVIFASVRCRQHRLLLHIHEQSPV